MHARADLRRQDYLEAPSSRDAAFFLAQALAEWAYLEQRIGTPERTRQLLEEAYNILRARTADLADDVAWQSLSGKTADRLGDWFFSLKQDSEKAELYYQEARNVAAKLLSAHPEDQAVRVNLADAWYHLGDLRDRRGDKLGTLEAFENELKTTQPLETSARAMYRRS